MAISEEDIAAVRAATDIVALITEQVALRRSGQRWVGLCPFHAEKTPSFSVNAQEGRYYCFGCHAAGDQITWVRETLHVEFADAVRQLADRVGIELHEDPAASRQRHERQRLLEAMERAVTWYQERLLTDPAARPARDYLRSRGIDGRWAREFRLGWAPDDWDAMARDLDLDARTLTGTGLGFINQRGRRQDAMRARIIFPILDPSGRPIALGGRILPGQVGHDGHAPAKYKNSSETAIYSKRRTLYGLNWAKEEIIRSGEIVVCEGYTDVIAFFQAGVRRAVATCGTALGEEHFSAMRNFARRIVLAYDADQAGQSAAAAVYQWERRHEVDVAVARLPTGRDPADVARQDPAALVAAVADAVPFLQFRLDRATATDPGATPEARARAGERAVEVLAEHPSDLVRDQYVMRVADRLGIDVTIVRERVRALLAGTARSIATPSPGETPPAPSARPARGAPPRPGVAALRLCVHEPSARAHFSAAYFVPAVQRRAFEVLIEEASVDAAIASLERQGQPEAADLLASAIVSELPAPPSAEMVAAVVTQLVRLAATAALRRLERQMRSGEITPERAGSVIRDVKARLEMLDTEQADAAVSSLRGWLEEESAP
ncbi:MAG: DNA primase [Acidimicrobiales bacterium]